MNIQANTPKWMSRAACVGADPDLFFPITGYQGVVTAKQAKEYCAGCQVRQPCLREALDNKITDGIWGGYTPKERSRLFSTIDHTNCDCVACRKKRALAARR